MSKDLTNLKSYLGLANQSGEFCPDMKQTLAPLKQLLSGKNNCMWNQDLQEAFDKSKDILCSDQVLKRFDASKQTILLTDTSRLGLGNVWIQTDKPLELGEAKHIIKKMPHGSLVTCGSRYLSKAKFNYAMCELELLALQWACKKAKLYLLGAPFVAVTYHQPLVAIVNGRNHNAHANPRIQRILTKLIRFDLTLYWTLDKLQTVTNALSRSPVWGSEDQQDILACSVRVAQANSVVKEATVYEAIKAFGDDTKSNKLKKKLIDLPRGHPVQNNKESWTFMAIEPDMPNLMLYMGRIMVPERAKAHIKESLHLAHVEKSKR